MLRDWSAERAWRCRITTLQTLGRLGRDPCLTASRLTAQLQPPYAIFRIRGPAASLAPPKWPRHVTEGPGQDVSRYCSLFGGTALGLGALTAGGMHDPF
jgi:hypothetical protein